MEEDEGNENESTIQEGESEMNGESSQAENDDATDEQEFEQEEIIEPEIPCTTQGNWKSENSFPENMKAADITKSYTELIDGFDDLDLDTNTNETLNAAMVENIMKGRELFNKLNSDFENTIQRGPGDVRLALMHTKLSSQVLRKRAERIGSEDSAFTLDAFLGNLKRRFVDEHGNYSPQIAVSKIVTKTGLGRMMVMPLVTVLGAFDPRDEPKRKKPRASITKTNMDYLPESETHDVVDPEDSPRALDPVETTTQMNKALRWAYDNQQKPIKLLDFALDKNSFTKTVDNMLKLSFLVKESQISVNIPVGNNHMDITIKPENKKRQSETSEPEEGQEQRNNANRGNKILSFSPRLWKIWSSAVQGENFFEAYERAQQLLLHEQQ